MRQKLSRYALAFIITLTLFFAYGFLTLGNMSSTGEALHYLANKTVTFSLGGAQTVDSVYVNVGTVYTKYGESALVEIEYTTSSSPNVTGGSNFNGERAFGNVYAEGAENGYNYNWFPIVTGAAKDNVRYLFFKADKNLQLNEIVCLDELGNVLPLMAYYQAENGYDEESLEKAVDAQGGFKISSSAYDNLTQEEGYYMTAVNNFLEGGVVFDGSVYNIAKNYNPLGIVFMAPAVAVFGDSAFALRLTPFLATCVMIAFAYLFAKDLFKSEKVAYLFSLLLMFGGLALTVGKMGTPLPFVFCALVASLYFTHRFFSYGVSPNKPLKGCLTVLASGIFAALAIAVETLAVLPALGIVALFVLGLRRVRAAEALALERVEGETEEMDGERRRIGLRYAYVKKTSISLVFLSFVMGAVLFLFLGAVLYYPMLVKAYDDPTQPSLGFLTLFLKAVLPSCSYHVASGFAPTTDLLAWLIPLRATTVYTAHTETAYLAWSVQMNAAAQVLSLVALVGSAVKVIFDFAHKKSDRLTKRFRRIFFVLLAGAALCMLAAALKGGAGMAAAYPFSVLYFGFIPLGLSALQVESGVLAAGKKLCLEKWLTAATVVLVAVFFLLTLPASFGFAVPQGLAKGLFGWTTIL